MTRAFSRRSSRLRLLQTLSIILFLWDCFEILGFRSLLLSSSAGDVLPDSRNTKIFIASIHWNNELILRSHWNNAVLGLVRHFGPDNVHVSIYESGSWDDSKGALRLLNEDLDRLGVPRTLVLDNTTHSDEIGKQPEPLGWVDTPRGKKQLRRIPYLARLRNLSLEPLAKLEKSGKIFDKVLFLNDVVFTTEDVLRLLNTNNGNYAAACALDFAKPPKYYDTFALRDSEGEEPLMQTWPFFRSRASRRAMKDSRPVPVASCWNGMVSMNASPFYNRDPPLRFRGIPDSLAQAHLEASECCLIHVDNPLTPSKGVWLNPNVRVAYSDTAYNAVHEGPSWLALSDYMRGIWENRLRRWMTTTWFKRRIVTSRMRMWKNPSGDHSEPGVHCLINEMQVLVGNGWAHV